MSPTQNTAKIWWDDKIQAYRLETPRMNDQLVTFLKSNIPSSDRHYDPQTKIWTYTEKYHDGVLKLCELIFGKSNVTVVTRQQVESAQQSYQSSRQGQSNQPTQRNGVSSTDQLLADFVRLLPFDAAQSAYRKAALTLHPDRQGGDMEKMTKLNALWARIEKEIFNQ